MKNYDGDGTTTCKPAASPVADTIIKFENMNKISVEKDGSQYVIKSPVKDLISLFEKNVDCVVEGADCSNVQEYKNVRMGKANIPACGMTKPAEESSFPDGRKVKKKVWMRLKSGLFGWKVITVKPVSRTSHTTIMKSLVGQSEVKKISNSNILEKWRLTARVGGGGGQDSELPGKRNFELNNKTGGKSGNKM